MDVQGVLREEFVQHGRHRELGKIVSLFERKSFELPSLIMVSNPFLADFIVHEFDIDRNKVETVLDNADTNLFMPRRKEDPIVDSVRSSLRIPKGIRICLYVGSFSKLQGIDVLLQAIKCVLENDDDLLFVLAGGRWSKDYLSYVQISRRLGISSHVRFIPGVSYVKILPYLLNLADIAVAPKRFSLQSHGKLAVLMASGLPTVAFDIGINRVFLDSLGIYAGEVSAEALGEAILRGMDRVDDGFRGRLRERALQHFSLQRLVGDMERVYARVAG